jgi:hypothetical protein
MDGRFGAPFGLARTVPVVGRSASYDDNGRGRSGPWKCIRFQTQLKETHVFDGFPAIINVIFRDGSEMTTISGNLCTLTRKEDEFDRIDCSVQSLY